MWLQLVVPGFSTFLTDCLQLVQAKGKGKALATSILGCEPGDEAIPQWVIASTASAPPQSAGASSSRTAPPDPTSREVNPRT